MTRPIVLCVVLMCGVASAAEAQETDSKPRLKPRDFSVTISPAHLMLPIMELTGEYRINDNLGVAGLVGVGEVTVSTSTTVRDGGDTNMPSTTTTTEESTATVFEFGAQVRYYIMGDFEHGMQIGVETVYLHAASEESSDPSASSLGDEFALGPFIGYKVVTGRGFTFDSQLGVQAVLVSSDTDTGESGSDSESFVLPLFNLNIGWTF